MPPATKHCNSKECLDSAQMMCDHESVLSMQYSLDQLKLALSRFYPQDQRRERGEMLFFDRGQFSGEFTKQLCDVKGVQNDVMKNSSLHEFFLKPCDTAPFTNALHCTPSKCCSYTHQLFGNHTRAGTGHQQHHTR